MKTQTHEVERVPQAPRKPLPELEEFLAPFEVHFHGRPGRRAMRQYVTGLLTEHPNKNCDTIAEIIPETGEQRLQNLLTGMDWDEEDLNRQRVRTMMRLATEGDGVLIFEAQNRHCLVAGGVGPARAACLRGRRCGLASSRSQPRASAEGYHRSIPPNAQLTK